jgi:hypothetical protein
VQAAAGDPAPAAPVRTPAATWQWDLTSGFDSYVHSYALSTDDTTVTLTEFMLQAGWEGQSAPVAPRRWRVRAEASAGTELYRERFSGNFRWLGDDRVERVRLEGSLWGRQYRPGTEYSQSSGSWEGRLEGRVAPLVGDRAKLDLRGWTGGIKYQAPSALEVDYRDLGAGVFARSAGLAPTIWGAGVRGGRRSYPDSLVIDRRTLSLEGDLDHHDLYGQGLRVYHKSERRLIRDEAVRPSAWTHWTDFGGAVVAGPGRVFLDAQAEVWRYDMPSDVYFNSVRVDGVAGYSWGDLLAATWKVGLAGERLDAGTSPETYTQFGLRGGVESYGSEVAGSLTLEYGRRVYGEAAAALAPDVPESILADPTDLYSDFHYWRIWLTGSWHISGQLDLDLMANYEPESHTERSDDAALGFASLRLRWRP